MWNATNKAVMALVMALVLGFALRAELKPAVVHIQMVLKGVER